jgi:hypothetical protein
MPASPADWEELSLLLKARRAELDPRYGNLRLFCAERGINYRVAWDIENHRRENFSRAILLEVDDAYGWVPKSASAFLEAGTRPVGAPGTPATGDDRPPLVLQHWANTDVQALWLLGIPVAQRLSLVETYLENQAAAERGA